MPRLKFIGEPAQALALGPMWEPGEEQEVSDEEAKRYLNNANWRLADASKAPSPPAAKPPEAPTPPPSVPEEAT